MLNYPWMCVGFDAWSLSIEASTVIALRVLTFAAGGTAAEDEARRMVNEKVETGFALQALALTGALGFTAHDVAARTLEHYRGKVRANNLRLAKA